FVVFLAAAFYLDNGPPDMRGAVGGALVIAETRNEALLIERPARGAAQIICALSTWFVRSETELYEADSALEALWQWGCVTGAAAVRRLFGDHGAWPKR